MSNLMAFFLIWYLPTILFVLLLFKGIKEPVIVKDLFILIFISIMGWILIGFFSIWAMLIYFKKLDKQGKIKAFWNKRIF